MPHTPGPWAYEEGDVERRACSNVFKAKDKEFAIAMVTCEWKNKQQRAEDIANAKLIAAAPDLLAALRDLADALNPIGPESESFLKKARHAIEKATA